jgi:hypothetical protein
MDNPACKGEVGVSNTGRIFLFFFSLFRSLGCCEKIGKSRVQIMPTIQGQKKFQYSV